MTESISFAALLERFFLQRLINQRQASPHTIKSYRDTFRQLLVFAHKRLRQQPSQLHFEQIDAPLIADFLEELETVRGHKCAQPQPASCGHPFSVSLCSIRVAGSCRENPKSACHSKQAIYAQTVRFSQSAGGGCAARGTRYQNLVRTARSCVHAHRGSDRLSAVRDDRAETQ